MGENIMRRRRRLNRAGDPMLRSGARKRVRRDEDLPPGIRRVLEQTRSVRGMRAVWRQLGREGGAIARATGARRMADMDLQGIVRDAPHSTTSTGRTAPGPLDQVARPFRWKTRFACPPR